MRRRSEHVLAAALLPFLLVAVLAYGQTAGTTWRDRVMDVYLDGRLDCTVQAFGEDGSHRLALVVPWEDVVLLLDRDRGVFEARSRAEFVIALDRGSARLAPQGPTVAEGPLGRIEEYSSVLSFKGHTIVVARHMGLVGVLDEAALFAAAPAWKAIMENAKPSASAVAAFRAQTVDTDVVVLLGTWCGDSRDQVPRLLKALHEASNPRLHVRLIGVDRAKKAPAEAVLYVLTAVPTVVVERGGKEIGRFVESPKGASVEDDLAAILASQ